MITIKVYFEDGNNLTTRFNGTFEEVKSYYVGNRFNFGVVEDKMVKCIAVDDITIFAS